MMEFGGGGGGETVIGEMLDFLANAGFVSKWKYAYVPQSLLCYLFSSCHMLSGVPGKDWRESHSQKGRCALPFPGQKLQLQNTSAFSSDVVETRASSIS